MTEFTSDMVDSFRADFDQAMKALEDKYDITVRLGNITYWKERFTADITVNSGRDPELIAAAEFDSQVWKYEEYGLTKGMYKRIFTGVNGKRYAFVGLNKNAKNIPWTFSPWRMISAIKSHPNLSRKLAKLIWLKLFRGAYNGSCDPRASFSATV